MTLISNKVMKVPMPEGMDLKDTIVVGAIGGIGLTVALFVCESAFVDATMIASAKMGALFSIGAAILAFVLNPVFRKGRKKIAEDFTEH
jgi:NhaA family Na+:H+ antiporter